jgi:large subunit ribosomal protein L15
MNLQDVRPNEGATHRKKRVGRGIGSGTGKTCGRGTKGLKARDTQRPGFEGGQTPLHRRLPHFRGFRSPFKKHFAILNLSDLEVFDGSETITPELLQERKIIGDLKDGVKVLGGGELTKKIAVRANHFSKSAEEAITKLGGVAETIPGLVPFKKH